MCVFGGRWSYNHPSSTESGLKIVRHNKTSSRHLRQKRCAQAWHEEEAAKPAMPRNKGAENVSVKLCLSHIGIKAIPFYERQGQLQ